MMNEDVLKKRISFIKTMCFFDIFDFSLTWDEICDYILYKRWTEKELADFVNHEKFVIDNNRNVHLEGRAITVNVRRNKEHRAKKLIQKAQKFIRYMQFLPFVRMIGICNGLAFYDSEKGSDIDIFIITEKKRLFTARLFAFFVTQILRIRRHGKKVKGRFCLSFIISNDAMNLEHLKLNDDDIYFFYWIRLLQPVIGEETYKAFINENKWISRYFEYEFSQNKLLIKKSGFQMTIQKIIEFPLKGVLGNWFESLLAILMKKRANKKAKKLVNTNGIIISDTVLKFHDVDMRGKFIVLWKKRISMFEKYFIPRGPGSETQDLWQYQQRNIPSEVHFQDIYDMKSEEH